MSASSLEAQLLKLGRALDVPETPDLATGVMARIAPRRVRAPRRRWVLAIALAVVAAGGATLAIPPARSACLRILHIGGQVIRIVDQLPAVKPELNLEVALGPRVTIAEAQRRVPFRIRRLDEKPDAVFFSVQTRTVWFLYGTPSHVRLLLAQTPGSVDTGIFAKKMASQGTHLDYVNVEGDAGLFLSGRPHFVMLLNRQGQPMGESVRLARDVLIWSHDRVAYRLEGELTKDRALEIATALQD